LNWFAVVSNGSYAGSSSTASKRSALFASYGLMDTLPERIISMIKKTVGIFGSRFRGITGG